MADPFKVPRRVHDMSEVDEPYQFLFEPDPSGKGFRMMPSAELIVLRHEQEMTEGIERYERDILEGEARIMRLERHVGKTVTATAIRSSLMSHGVPRLLLAAAQARLLETLDIVVEGLEDERPAATVRTPYGVVSVDHAVAVWLHSEEGSHFLPNGPDPSGPTADGFAAKARRLRTVH